MSSTAMSTGTRALYLEGSAGEMGRAHGEVLREAVRRNLSSFWGLMNEGGYHRDDVTRSAVRREGLLRPERSAEIEGLAKGARVAYPELLAYNLFGALAFPDECSAMLALGKATANGRTLFLKNSDKVGGASLVGPNFHRFKEINVVLAVTGAGGNRMLGVSAAGSTGYKLAMNDKGVAGGSNIARTVELREKSTDLTTIRAIDRAQLLRDGLEKNTALEAAQAIAAEVTAHPMGTPGNLEFADAQEAYIIEGSYKQLAVETIREGVAARANQFVVLKALNRPDDISSYARWTRAMALLESNAGKLTFEMMMEFSADHVNGPGPNSLCRHGGRPEEEVSLAAGVMETNPDDPAKSRIALALGKPCHAWRDPAGHVHLTMDASPSEIPAGFRNGDVWKEFYREDARER